MSSPKRRLYYVLRFTAVLMALAALAPWWIVLSSAGSRAETAAWGKGFLVPMQGTARVNGVSGPSQDSDQSTLGRALASPRSNQFLPALDRLSALDDQAAIDLWQSALDNPEPRLKALAWSRYRRDSA